MKIIIRTTIELLACDVQPALAGLVLLFLLSLSLFSLFVLFVVGGIVYKLQLLLTEILTSSHQYLCSCKALAAVLSSILKLLWTSISAFLEPWWRYLPSRQAPSSSPLDHLQRTASGLSTDQRVDFGSTGQRACSNTCLRLFIPSLPPRWSYFWLFYISELARLPLQNHRRRPPCSLLDGFPG